MSARKVVFAAAGSIGEIIPIVGLAAGMQARGHDTKVVASEAYRKLVEQAGLPFAPMRPDLIRDPDVLTAMWKNPLLWVRNVQNPWLRETYDDLARASEGADMLVSRFVVAVAPLVAEKLRLKWVQVQLAPAELNSIYDPPYYPGLGLLRLLVKLWPQGFGVIQNLFIRAVKRYLCPQMNELRLSLGLPRTASPDYSGAPPALDLALFSPVMGRSQPDWPANTVTTGYVFIDEDALAAALKTQAAVMLSENPGQFPSEAKPTPPLAEATETFLAAGAPPVVFAFGSMQYSHINRDVVRLGFECIERIGARGVLLCGLDSNRIVLPKTLPDTIHILEQAPFRALFPRASAIVHHGGSGTLAAALRAGVPQLVLPQNFDQPDNAVRIVKLGVGRAEFRHQFNSNRIARHLRAILSNPVIRDRAAEVGRQIKAERGVTSACDAMEACLQTSGSGSNRKGTANGRG